MFQMGDRVGPVGTGEASSPPEAPASAARLSPVNWSMSVDRQEALVGTGRGSDLHFRVKIL